MNKAIGPDSAVTSTKRWFSNALVRHDVAIIAANLRDLLTLWRDGAAVAFLTILAILFVRNSLTGLASSTELVTVLIISSVAAISCDLSLRSRVRYFQQESPLAAAALARQTEFVYRLVAHGVASTAICLVLCTPNWTLAVQFIISWWVSLLPVALLASIGSAGHKAGIFEKFGWLATVWRSRRFGVGWKLSTTVLALIIAGLPWTVAEDVAAIVAGSVSFIALAWFSPVDYAIINFERLSGHPPRSSVRAILLRPAQIGLLLFASAIASMSLRSAAMVAAVATIILLYRYLTIMLSRIVSPRQVQFAMVVVVGITLSAAFTFPYIAPLPMILMVIWLNRHAARRTWVIE